jgi:hypothetical protein
MTQNPQYLYPDIDWDGVKPWITNNSARCAFGELVTKYAVPKARQAALAAHLQGIANQKRDGRLTEDLVRSYLSDWFRNGDWSPDELMEELGIPDVEAIRDQHGQASFAFQYKKFKKSLSGLYHSSNQMIQLKDRYPDSPFHMDQSTKDSLWLTVQALE